MKSNTNWAVAIFIFFFSVSATITAFSQDGNGLNSLDVQAPAITETVEYVQPQPAPIVAAQSKAEVNHFIQCALDFKEKGHCPQTTCMLGCVGGLIFEGCEVGCHPKPCVEIEAKACPTGSCDILTGCSHKDVCYDKVYNPYEGCGDLAYPGQDVECCEGLVKRCGLEFFNGSCDMEAKYSEETVPLCLPCGNGTCNQFENRCNCPEDCR